MAFLEWVVPSRPEDGSERRGAVKPRDGGRCAEGREDRSRRYRRRYGRHGWPGTGQRSCVRRVTTATPEWFGWGRQRPGAVARDRASVCPAWRRAGSHRRQLASASTGQRGRLPMASGGHANAVRGAKRVLAPFRPMDGRSKSGSDTWLLRSGRRASAMLVSAVVANLRGMVVTVFGEMAIKK